MMAKMQLHHWIAVVSVVLNNYKVASKLWIMPLTGNDITSSSGSSGIVRDLKISQLYQDIFCVFLKETLWKWWSCTAIVHVSVVVGWVKVKVNEMWQLRGCRLAGVRYTIGVRLTKTVCHHLPYSSEKLFARCCEIARQVYAVNVSVIAMTV